MIFAPFRWESCRHDTVRTAAAEAQHGTLARRAVPPGCASTGTAHGPVASPPRLTPTATPRPCSPSPSAPVAARRRFGFLKLGDAKNEREHARGTHRPPLVAESSRRSFSSNRAVATAASRRIGPLLAAKSCHHRFVAK